MRREHYTLQIRVRISGRKIKLAIPSRLILTFKIELRLLLANFIL